MIERCKTFLITLLTYLIPFIMLILIDRITKAWAFTALDHHDIYFLPFFRFTLLWNRGVSWGLFNALPHQGFYLLSLSIALVCGIFAWYTFTRLKKNLSIFWEILVLAGALSNIIDRIHYGAVLDFIDFSLAGIHWPTIFNLADLFVVIGVGGILIRNVVTHEISI